MHRQGSRHGNADALSRIPCKQCGNEDDQVDEIGAITGPFLQQLNNLGEVQRLQAEDDDIAPVLNAVKVGNVPPGDTTKSWSRESRLLLQQWEMLKIKHDALWRKFSDGKKVRLQLVLPSRLHKKVIRDLHEGAVSEHLGEEKVLSCSSKNDSIGQAVARQ